MADRSHRFSQEHLQHVRVQRVRRLWDWGMQRDRPDGTSEVARMHRGRLNVYLAHGDGTTELIESFGPTPRYTIGRRLALAGLTLWLIVLFGGFAFQPNNSVLWIGGPFALGLLLVFLGSLVSDDLRSRLRTQAGSDEDWIEAVSLGGWGPPSSAQLLVVMELGDNGERKALVRSRGQGIVEVASKRDGHVYRHLVDLTGAVIQEDVVPPSMRHVWGVRLAKGGLVVALASLFPLILALAWADVGQAWTSGIRPALIGGIVVGLAAYFVGLMLENDLRASVTTDSEPTPWFTVVSSQPSE